jgi:hypothetical protein
METGARMDRIEEWEIRDAQAWPLRVAAGEVLRVASGRVWLTVERGGEDIWLLPGEAWRAREQGCVWLSAEPVARLQRLTPVRGKLRRRWAERRAWPALPSLRALLRFAPWAS